jgi:hypothetical protein
VNMNSGPAGVSRGGERAARAKGWVPLCCFRGLLSLTSLIWWRLVACLVASRPFVMQGLQWRSFHRAHACGAAEYQLVGAV